MSSVLPAGTVMPLKTIEEQEPLDAAAVSASVKVQPEEAVTVPELAEALGLLEGAATEAEPLASPTALELGPEPYDATPLTAAEEIAPPDETEATLYEANPLATLEEIAPADEPGATGALEAPDSLATTDPLVTADPLAKTDPLAATEPL